MAASSVGPPEVERLQTTNSQAQPDILEKGLQLACFISSDRSTAIDILIGALDKLKVECRRQKRRFYWRFKHPTHPIRFITRKDSDTLQWLIMFESEQYEKQQEGHGPQSARDMAIRYVKYLIRVTTSMSSFYVAVGVNRLLYDYGTSETQTAYEMLTQRFLGADQYRRAKSTLMKSAQQRFGGLLRTCKTRHGEIRFEPDDNQGRWRELVTECLTLFTPWSTEALCARLAVPGNDTVKFSLNAIGTGTDKGDRNGIDVSRCHILIEPVCSRRLSSDLSLDPPETKLALPRFFMNKEEEIKDDSDGQRGRRFPKLSQDERSLIAERIESTDVRRRRIQPSFLEVVVDGIKRARVNLKQKGSINLDLEAGAKAVEIHGEDEGGELLLATHLISYTEDSFKFAKETVLLNGGKLDLVVSPTLDFPNSAPRAALTLRYSPRFRLVLSDVMRGIVSESRRPLASHAITGLTLALIAWGVTWSLYSHKIRLQKEVHEKAIREQIQSSATPTALAHYVLAPDDRRMRGPTGYNIPRIPARAYPTVVSLDVPFSEKEGSIYRADLKTFAGDRELLIENSLRARRTATGLSVDIVLPGDWLESQNYYTIHLRSITRDGQVQQVSRFTFYLAGEK